MSFLITSASEHFFSSKSFLSALSPAPVSFEPLAILSSKTSSVASAWQLLHLALCYSFIDPGVERGPEWRLLIPM